MPITRVLKSEEMPDDVKQLLGGTPCYGVGNVALLWQPAIGLCGSRNASANALEWAYKFGREAARQGIVVVSGYARGVDREAHRGALEGGGSTIAVLPQGIEHFRVTGELRASADLERNMLALSMFEPRAGWAVWRAMRRNKLIVGLSSGLFVVEASDRGGTIDAAHECMRQGKRLWAVAYRSHGPGREGNRKLLASAAMPLEKMDDFTQALENAMERPPPEVRQLVMSVMRPEGD